MGGVMAEHTFGSNEISFERDAAFLYRDKIEQRCPFSNPSQWRCGNWCPHFKLRKNVDRMVLTLTCGNGAPTMTIEKETD
jgi:hypothetical protein